MYPPPGMDRVVVIANPIASQFTGGTHRDVMSTLAKTHDVDAVWPSTTRETTEHAIKAADEGASVVVAMGGDGLVHHVAQGLVGRGASLGIIPVGTTNVVARLLQIPSRPSKAVKLIERSPGPAILGVATIRLTRESTATTHHALFAAGFGLDAEVVVEADRDPYRKYRFGSWHYARTALSVGVGRFPSRRPHVRVDLAGTWVEATTALIQFRDVYTYFGMIPLRTSSGEPDPMTVLTLDRLRRRRVPSIALRAILHRDLGAVAGVDLWHRVNHLELEADPPVAAQADGESLGLIDAATIEWTPEALHVIGGP